MFYHSLGYFFLRWLVTWKRSFVWYQSKKRIKGKTMPWVMQDQFHPESNQKQGNETYSRWETHMNCPHLQLSIHRLVLVCHPKIQSIPLTRIMDCPKPYTEVKRYIAESTLSRAVGSTPPDTWDPGNSTASTPRLCGGLMASLLADSIGLALVFGHICVHKVHHIRADGCLEHCRQGGLASGFSIFIVHCDQWTGSLQLGWINQSIALI